MSGARLSGKRASPSPPPQVLAMALSDAGAAPLAPSILSALADPNLLAPHFPGPSWDAWKAFLAALFGLPLRDDALATFRAATGRQTPPDRAATEAALIVGRRGGKSRVLATIAVYLATFRDYAPHLAPGEVATVMVIAANRAQARSIFRYVNGLLEAVPLLTPLVRSATEDAIVLADRVVIEIGTASFRVTRGYTFAAVLADEVAFWRSEESSANPDVEILRALRPGLASIPGSMLLLASSPYAKKGELYAAFKRHHGREDARVLVWKADTATMNPRIDPAIIAEAYESDPEAARAEYGAEFRDDLADFVTKEAVDAVTMWGRRELPAVPGVTYAAFCDPSGGAADAMTLAIGHLRDGEVCVLDAVLEVRPPFDPERAVAECAALLQRFGVTRVVGDRYAGEWPRARFREHGVDFEQSARPKSDLYHDLLPLLNARRVELIEHPRLAAQLVGLERRVARSGRDSIDHAPGGHDDLANAVAGVLVGLDLDRRPPLVPRSALLHAGATPSPLPPVADCAFAVVAVDARGSAAVAYCVLPAYLDPKLPARLLLWDFDPAPATVSLFADALERLRELATRTRLQRGEYRVFAPQALIGPPGSERLGCLAIPGHLTEFDTGLLIRAAQHVGDGAVRLGEPALARSRSAPLAGALDFKAGEVADDPLRLAVLWSIILSLESDV